MSQIEMKTIDELRAMKYTEGFIIQGCGGDLNEWIDGINEILAKEQILLKGTKFDTAYVFKHEELTNILFPFSNDIKLNVGKLAIWRLATMDTFGGTWLSDYVDNKLGGFIMSEFERAVQKLDDFINTESSFDFQCDIAGGYPICLMWNRIEERAWLYPNEHLCDNSDEFETALKACEEFGIRECCSIEEFNRILDNLGEDASSCKIYDDYKGIDIY